LWNNDFDLLKAIGSLTNLKLNGEIESLTSVGSRVMELDNYLKSEPDVEEVCGFQCRYDSEASNTDKMILKIPPLSAGLGSTVDNETDALETANEVVIGCYCCIRMLLMMDLNNNSHFNIYYI
jgi:hypothetical protein